MTENDVEAAIVRFLRNRGWVVDRNTVAGAFTADGRHLSVGRRGQADWRAARDNKHRVHYLEVEVKAPGKRPSPRQREYLALRAHQGIAATWADSVESFADWYAQNVGDD